MIEFLALVLLATSFAYLSNKYKFGLEIAFILIIVFAAIRYNYGNDYIHYLEGFEFYTSHYDIDNVSELRTEIGWFYLIFLFQDLGFYWLVAVLTIIEQVIVYYFIKKYVDKDVYWIAVFVYLISTDLFLTNLSMMRQAAAISLCMVGYEFIIRRKIIPSIAMVIVASFIHASALLTLPFVLVSYFLYGRIQISTSFIFVTLISIIGLNLFSEYLPSIDILSIFGNSYVEQYGAYLSVEKTTTFGISTVVSFILLYMMMMYQRFQNPQTQFIILLFILGCFIEAFGTSIYLVDRIALYFTYLMPICYSMTLKHLRKNSWFPIFMFFFILLKLYNYKSFISIGWGQSFQNYQTIFDF